MTSYVVTVAGPEPTWVRWDSNTGLPCFTFSRPEGLSLEDAETLKLRADICCGGDLEVTPVDGFKIQRLTRPGGAIEWVSYKGPTARRVFDTKAEALDELNDAVMYGGILRCELRVVPADV